MEVGSLPNHVNSCVLCVCLLFNFCLFTVIDLSRGVLFAQHTKTSRVGSLEITSFSLNSVAFGTWTMIRHHHHHPYFNKLAKVRAPHCHYLRSMDKGIDWHSHAQDGTVIHYLISMNKGTPHKLELCALRKTFINYWHSLFPQFFIFFFQYFTKEHYCQK